MKSKLLILASAVVLFASCSKTDTNITPATEKANIETVSKNNGKPFKGSLAFTFNPSADLACNCQDYMPAGTYTGSGELSHLGLSTSEIKPCIAPIFSGNALVGYHVGIQCGYFIAANGDRVDCAVQPYDLMFTAMGGAGNVTVNFAGGTGRFKNATGSFTGYTTNDGQGNVTLTNINGTINY